jgi:hypothetical protein
MSEKEPVFECDGCHEIWETAFRCPICSTIELAESNHYDPDDEDDQPEQTVTREICGNCCTCHLKPITQQSKE